MVLGAKGGKAVLETTPRPNLCMRSPDRSIFVSQVGFYEPLLSVNSSLQEFKSQTQKQEFSSFCQLV